MASLIDLFKAKEEEYKINNGGDKTPLSNDGGINLIADESLVDAARRGAINNTPYSSTVNF